MRNTIEIKSKKRIDFINITRQIEQFVNKKHVSEGICIFLSHTPLQRLTINESADPDVIRTIEDKLNKAGPAMNEYYLHSEGNSDAHIKSSILGSVCICHHKGSKLLLGTWQGIFFCEFDGPRNRKLHIKIL
jgi:secondary thiamine-phosphate synthase enzyme